MQESKVVVITGASSGIGAALAETLAHAGHTVVLVARRLDALREVASRCRERAHVVAADVTDRAQVERIVTTALERFGQIDVWVNNAGVGITRVPSELTDEDLDAMIAANVKSVLYGMQSVLPHFKARGTGQIVNVSSMLGRMPFAVIRTAYSGAKHYVNALTAGFRAELADAYPGIVVSLVSPGVVFTDFGKNALHGGPDSRAFPEGQTPADVAAVIADVIATRRPDVYTRTGARARVIGYYSDLGEDP